MLRAAPSPPRFVTLDNLIEDDFIVHARDAQGHRETMQVPMSPSMRDSVFAIHSGMKFPVFESPAAIVRLGVSEIIKALHQLSPGCDQGFWSRTRAIQEVVSHQEKSLAFTKTIDSLGNHVQELMRRGMKVDRDQALRLIDKVRSQVEEMGDFGEDGYWKQRYLEGIIDIVGRLK